MKSGPPTVKGIVLVLMAFLGLVAAIFAIMIASSCSSSTRNWRNEPQEWDALYIIRLNQITWEVRGSGYLIQTAGCESFVKEGWAHITGMWVLVIEGGDRCPMTMMYPKPEHLGSPWQLAP